jgi:transposase
LRPDPSFARRGRDTLPGREGHVGGTAPDNRLFIEAVLYAPAFQRFNRWAKSGVFERVFKVLDHDNEYMMLDATIVRAHQHSAGAPKKTASRRSAARAAD